MSWEKIWFLTILIVHSKVLSRAKRLFRKRNVWCHIFFNGINVNIKYLPRRASIKLLHSVINKAYGYDDYQKPWRNDGVHNYATQTQENKMNQTLHRRTDFLKTSLCKIKLATCLNHIYIQSVACWA